MFHCNSDSWYTQLEHMPKLYKCFKFYCTLFGIPWYPVSRGQPRTLIDKVFDLYCLYWCRMNHFCSHQEELKIQSLHTKPSLAEIDFSSHRHRRLISCLLHARYIPEFYSSNYSFKSLWHLEAHEPCRWTRLLFTLVRIIHIKLSLNPGERFIAVNIPFDLYLQSSNKHTHTHTHNYCFLIWMISTRWTVLFQ